MPTLAPHPGSVPSPESVPFKTGEPVVVRPLSEILDTLDEQGTIDGIPFMPEMIPYCGRTFRVTKHVEHVFLDHLNFVGRLTDTVILDGLRCDGGGHGGCQMGCQLLWKTAWLAPAHDAPSSDEPTLVSLAPYDLQSRLPTEQQGRMFCQGSALEKATTRLPWWDARQYLRTLRHGELGIGQLIRMIALMLFNKLRWRCGLEPYGMLAGPCAKTTAMSLDLQPGEWVEVKSREEIVATLDQHGKNRGLAFVPEMALFCGQRFQVSHRVEKMVVEGTGELRDVKHTVALIGVTCCGLAQRRCPRGCFHLWREAWLKRAP